jgi:hypothetical protein
MQNLTFNAQAYSPQRIAEALREHGCVLLRNILPREAMLAFGSAVQANVRDLASWTGIETNDLPLCFSDQSEPCAVAGVRGDQVWWRRGYGRWRPFWEHGQRFENSILALVARSQLPAVYRRLYRELVIGDYQHCVTRFQRPDISSQAYAFHQDNSAFGLEDAAHVGLTTWVPLVDAGINAPGLQLYPRPTEVLPTRADAPVFVDDAAVLARYGDQLWSPVVSAGDVMVFNHFILHRTHFTATMTKERQSVEIRVYPASRLPAHIKEGVGWKFEI